MCLGRIPASTIATRSVGTWRSSPRPTVMSSPWMTSCESAAWTPPLRQRLTNVVASANLLIWEAELITPADDPYCCSQPSVVWLQTLEQDRVRSLRLFHPRP